jgi:hypothetical protein
LLMLNPLGTAANTAVRRYLYEKAVRRSQPETLPVDDRLAGEFLGEGASGTQ